MEKLEDSKSLNLVRKTLRLYFLRPSDLRFLNSVLKQGGFPTAKQMKIVEEIYYRLIKVQHTKFGRLHTWYWDDDAFSPEDHFLD